MNKKDRIRLMGAVVTVTKALRLHEADSLGGWNGPYIRTWNSEPLVEKRAGWIVGFTHRRNGTTSFRGEGGSVFKPTACVPCVLVKYWPTLDAIEVPLDGFTPGGTPDNHHARWPESYRQQYKVWAKDFPRRNGRFCKYVHANQKPS